MKNKLLIVLVSLFLFNCTNNKRDSNVKSFYTLIQLQKSTSNKNNEGYSTYYDFKELSEDKSEFPKTRSRIQLMYSKVIEIEELTQQTIELINQIKIKHLKENGENLSQIISSNEKPTSFNYSEIKNLKEIELDYKDISNIVKTYKSFRKELCKILISSNYTEGAFYTFKPFDINEFNDYKDLYNKFDKEISKSNIALDDIEAIKQVYLGLTKSDENWNSLLNGKSTWIDVFSILEGLSYDIYQARNFGYLLIKSRICISEYNFNKMEVLVNGPNVAKIGDTITLTLFMGAYNTDNQPIVKSQSNENGFMIKNGKATLKYVIRNKKDMEYNGTISLISKSGDLKSFPWNHKVKVIQ